MFEIKYTKQSGAVLFVGLMMLLIMSLIAVTSMQGSTLEVRMAGNTRDSLVALQSAEAALQAGEALIDTGLLNLVNFDTNGIDGLYDNSVTDLWATRNWDANDSIAYAVADGYTQPGNVTTVPRYIIQHISQTEVVPKLLIENYGEGEAGKTIELFRVTARGTGGSNNTEVVFAVHLWCGLVGDDCAQFD